MVLDRLFLDNLYNWLHSVQFRGAAAGPRGGGGMVESASVEHSINQQFRLVVRGARKCVMNAH